MSVAAMGVSSCRTDALSPVRWSWLLVPAILLAIAAAQTVFGTKSGELGIYLKAAERMAAGEAIYHTDDGPAFSYPPFFAIVFVPLTWCPLPAANFIWNSLNLLFLGGSIWMLRQALSPMLVAKDHKIFATWSVAAMVLSARFVVSPLEYRSHDLILLAILLGGLSGIRRNREGLCGIACGIATACKATPLLFLPLLLVQRRWLASVCFVIALAFATLLPDVLCPAKTGSPWVRQWYDVFVSRVETTGPADAPGAWRAWNPLNQSLSGTIYRLTNQPDQQEFSHLAVTVAALPVAQRKLITLAALGFVFMATLTIAARRPPEREGRDITLLAQWSLVLTAMLLLSPMSSKQHFCVLILPLSMLSAAVFSSWRGPCSWLFALPLLGVFLLGNCLAKDIVGKQAGDLALAWGSLTWCALLCWTGSAAMLLWQMRGAVDDPATSPDPAIS